MFLYSWESGDISGYGTSLQCDENVLGLRDGYTVLWTYKKINKLYIELVDQLLLETYSKYGHLIPNVGE